MIFQVIDKDCNPRFWEGGAGPFSHEKEAKQSPDRSKDQVEIDQAHPDALANENLDLVDLLNGDGCR